NNKFANLSEIWISGGSPSRPSGDHYKWRLMRAAGFDEKYISGSGAPEDKFKAFAQTLQNAPGNPIFEWSHLELKRFFGIDEILTAQNANEIYQKVNSLLAGENFRPRDFIKKANVEIICTTDDPADDLQYHKLLAEEETGFRVLPAFRPDKIIHIENSHFGEYINKISQLNKSKIKNLNDFTDAIIKRIDYFHNAGCRLSDHGLDTFHFEEFTKTEIEKIFKKRLADKLLTDGEIAKYQTYIYIFLASQYAKKNWVMQFHINAIRNINKPAFDLRGADTGYDSINDISIGQAISKFFNKLEIISAEQKTNLVPRTILYSLNKNDYLTLITMGTAHLQNLGLYGVKQKFQLGSAWWFNDTRDGMLEQLRTFAEETLLGNFVGMLTDSRSFLSYTRHEYFRRCLCDYLGQLASRGQLPNDLEFIGNIVKNICYNNAKEYFGF
ncbi:MAG: glucuronate isomerase, partial [Bifidobacteriaceae bacterium]|nr:glucuronate isomerase [Bifidobacteriaceae bacterium]